MLLRNESKVKYSIQIRLIFDDDRRRNLEIQVGDKIQVSYRRNGRIKCDIGIIKEIKPYIHSKRWHFSKKESAIIIVDMSEENVAMLEKIDMYDIIDIRKILPTESETEPDFEIENTVTPDEDSVLEKE